MLTYLFAIVAIAALAYCTVGIPLAMLDQALAQLLNLTF